MPKEKVTNISAVGIIFNKSNPAALFLERKDKTYPIEAFRENLGLVGGNWIGKSAKKDRGPLDTFRREIEEEISLRKIDATTLELKLLGIIKKEKRYRVPWDSPRPTKSDLKTLKEVKRSIKRSAKPLGDFLSVVPKKLMLEAGAKNHRGDFINLCSAYLVPLNEKAWRKLLNLQSKFGNLSNESTTLILPLEKIIKGKIMFGHDRILKDFLSYLGQKSIKKIRLNKKIKSRKLGRPLKSYRNYLYRYEIEKRSI